MGGGLNCEFFHFTGTNIGELRAFLPPDWFPALVDGAATIIEGDGVEFGTMVPGDRLERSSSGMRLWREPIDVQ